MNEKLNFIVGVKILDKEGMLKPIYKRTYREFMMILLPRCGGGVGRTFDLTYYIPNCGV